ncbi:unnamed protein product [Prorocentrum cordatum]|uniref:Uncharacterized protein n=1 Tax=Prorocentrum cordatum TaxID=2364126 RepID=A0ABN9SYM6_9DINO|nr:unnamed protein product [Polarella glacialis]
MALRPGDVVLVRYDDDLWHERLILFHIQGHEYVVCSPDYDIFVEQLDAQNPDLTGIRFPAAPGAAVMGVGRARAFSPRPTAAQQQQLLAEGQQVGAAELTARGLPAAAPPGAPVAGAAGAAPAAVLPAGGAAAAAIVPAVAAAPPLAAPAAAAGAAAAAPVAPAAAAPAAAAAAPAVRRIAGVGGAWVLDEPAAGFSVGFEVQAPAGIHVVDSRAFLGFNGRTRAFRLLAAGTDIDQYVMQRQTELAIDRRTISVDPTGRPRAFAECAAEMIEDPNVKYSLSGPRTGGYLVERTARGGGGGLVHEHDKWVAESGAKPRDRSVHEHQVLTKALQIGATEDGLNLRNLGMAELPFRRKQLIEEVHADNPHNPSWDGWEHYLGIEERKGGAGMAPSLRQHVASEMGKQAAVDKEKRKAREAKKGGKSGKDDSANKDSNAAVEALNALYGCETAPASTINDAQAAAHRHILRTISSATPSIPVPTPEEASREFLGHRLDYHGDGSAVVPYDGSKVSLPDGSSPPVPLADVLPPRLSEVVRIFEDLMLSDRPEDDVKAEQAQVAPYFDERLRADRSLYISFLARMAAAAGIAAEQTVVGSWPVPPLDTGPITLPYCDNVTVFGLSADRALGVRDRILEGFQDAGFQMHDITEAEPLGTVLGASVGGEPATVRRSIDRMWLIRGALLWMASQKRASGEQVEALIGHFVSAAIFRRPALSILRACYEFTRVAGKNHIDLWASVQYEFWLMAAVLPVLSSDMSLGWAGEVWATDACKSGYGACKRILSSREVGDIGRWNERWRFRRLQPSEWAPRARALGEFDAVVDPRTVDPDGSVPADRRWIEREGFPEVPFEVCQKGHWKTVYAGRFRYCEYIGVLEGRAFLWALRRVARYPECHGARRLFLVDNYGLALALTKGRATSFGFLQVCRRSAAIQLAANLSCSARWIPSEWNPSDEPSRLFERAAASRRAVGRPERGWREHLDGRGPWSPESRGRPGKGADGRQARRAEQAGGPRAAALGDSCTLQCETYFDAFRRWVANEVKEPLPSTASALSNLLLDYLDVLLEEGNEYGDAEKVVAAVKHHMFSVPGVNVMPRVTRALKGFRKKRPPRSRAPIPRLVMAGLVTVLKFWGLHDLALMVLMSWVAYLRPGEARGLKVKDLVAPVGRKRRRGQQSALDHWSIVVAPQEDYVVSKTGTFDDAIALDSPSWAGPALEKAAGRRAGEELLLSVEAGLAVSKFRAAATPLGLPGLCLYQLRHGGASGDLLTKARGLSEIMARGRWLSGVSVRRCAKAGQVQKLLHALPRDAKLFCEWADENLQGIIEGAVAPRLPAGSSAGPQAARAAAS